MSDAPKMIDCPRCSIRDLEEPRGIVRRYVTATTFIRDICDRCGGSGRIPQSQQKMFDRKTLMMKKRQKQNMREWIALEKELVYGVKE
jgi:hypothetical protein